MHDLTRTGRNPLLRIFSSFIIFILTFSLIIPPSQAQLISNLPEPGQLVRPSEAFNPVVVRGLKINPDNPFLFDFIVDRGDSILRGASFEDESERLIKYFLAALTIPDQEAWVNLSPYEEDRIIPDFLAMTEMGRDMLAQDYLLKQVSASLTNPDEKLGQKFWKNVYDKAQKLYGTTEIPINTFNKVWIVPDKAVVLEDEGTAFVAESHLKVMLEEDYVAVKENLANKKFATDMLEKENVEDISALSSSMVRDIIIPALEKEVNEGRNFTTVRQIYHSVILATWFKQALKESLLGKVYVNQRKVAGVDVDDPEIKDKIYQTYLEAFRKGVYNLIKEDYDLTNQRTLPRKYFSGGLVWEDMEEVLDRERVDSLPEPQVRSYLDRFGLPGVRQAGAAGTRAMLGTGGEGLGNQFAMIRAQMEEGSASMAIKPKADQAIMSERLRDLEARSRNVVARMRDAYEKGDMSAVDAAFEDARVDVPGSSNLRPSIFTVTSPRQPEEIDITKLSLQDIQQRIRPYLADVTEEEARMLQSQAPFIPETPEQEIRNGLIQRAALKAGLFGVRYYVTNIKRFSSDSPLGRIEDLQRIVDEYNGYAVVFVSTEEEAFVLSGDGSGMSTAMLALRSLLGQDFLDNNDIDIITDGGRKERGAGMTATDEYNGGMLTPYGIEFFERAMEALGKIRLQHYQYGKGRVFWTASDGDYKIGKLTYGNHNVADLKENESWGVMTHGKGQEVIGEDLADVREALKTIWARVVDAVKNEYGLSEFEGYESLTEDQQDYFNKQFYQEIHPLKETSLSRPVWELSGKLLLSDLPQLGNFLTDPETGLVVDFKEKPTPETILRILQQHGQTEIIPNAFVLVYTKDYFNKVLDIFEKFHEWRGVGGSYFQQTVQGIFEPEVNSNFSNNVQTAIEEHQNLLNGTNILGVNLGELGNFTDRGKQYLLTDSYWERIAALKEEGKSGLIEEGVVRLSNVTLDVQPGATVVMSGAVRISSEKPVTLTIPAGAEVFIQDSDLKLYEDTTYGNKTLIVRTKNERPIVPDQRNRGTDFYRLEEVALIGIVDQPGEQLFDMAKASKGVAEFEPVDVIEAHAMELIVGIKNRPAGDEQGQRYINRGIIRSQYKGAQSGFDLGQYEGEFLIAQDWHPRLVGIKGVSDQEVKSRGVQWLDVTNYLAPGGRLVSLPEAKQYMDFLGHVRELRAMKDDIINSATDAVRAIRDEQLRGQEGLDRAEQRVRLTARDEETTGMSLDVMDSIITRQLNMRKTGVADYEYAPVEAPSDAAMLAMGELEKFGLSRDGTVLKEELNRLFQETKELPITEVVRIAGQDWSVPKEGYPLLDLLLMDNGLWERVESALDVVSEEREPMIDDITDQFDRAKARLILLGRGYPDTVQDLLKFETSLLIRRVGIAMGEMEERAEVPSLFVNHLFDMIPTVDTPVKRAQLLELIRRSGFDLLKVQTNTSVEGYSEDELKQQYARWGEGLTIEHSPTPGEPRLWARQGPSPSAAPDQAVLAQPEPARPPGGIDFDPALLDLQIKRDDHGVPLPLPMQNLDNINIDGLYPVIIDVSPVTIQNFPLLLSLESAPGEEKEAEAELNLSRAEPDSFLP